MIAAFERELAANAERMILACSSADIMRAKREGRVAMLLSLEGVEPLGQDLGLLRTFYELGIRLAGLTWNRHNAAADGWDAPPEPGGLTPFGEQVLREMAELGMVVDIAHLAKPGFWQVVDHARGPIIGFHCVTWGDRHSLDDGQLRAVAGTGGVVCAIGVKQPDIHAIVKQIRHIADVAGVEHVGFGADYYGLDLAPRGLEDAAQYPNLTTALLQAEFAEPEVAGIMGRNLLRVLEAVL